MKLNLQLTLALIKPDVMARPHTAQLIRKLMCERGFYLIRSQIIKLSREDAERFYLEHKGKFFYNRLVSYMGSGSIGAHVLARYDAIPLWRQMMGPTKVYRTIYSDPQSIRGQFGLTDTRNSTHGSDSVESAKKEIKFYFPDFNIDQWYVNEEEAFRKGDVGYDEEKMVHFINTGIST